MKKIIILFLGCAILTGCVDLEQKPFSTLTPETIVYDESNIRAYANGLYKELWFNNYGFNCRPQILGLGADDIVTGTLTKRGTFIDELNASSNQHDGDFQLLWQNLYSVIRLANTMIEAIPNSNDVPREVQNPYVGEAYFMRAFSYFHLTRYFGRVPLFKDPNCIQDIYGNTGKGIVQASIEDVYLKMIVPDLKEAEQLLKDRSRTEDNSTASKMAAKACLIDVYLTMAGWPLKKTEYYAQARDLALEFINSNPNGHDLLPNYADLWKEETKSSDTEHIFALNHSTTYSMASNYGRSYYAIEESSTAWSDYLADSCFFERHPADERKTFNFVDRFPIAGTPRTVDFRKTSMRSPSIAKYRDYGTAGSAQSNGITPFYRYADILLMYAEAQNMADGGPNTLAYDCLNKIRQRAVGAGTYEKAENMDQETFAKAVFDERGWEFFAEFKRWFHLVRTEKVYEANQYNPRVKSSMDKYGVTPDNRKIYLMPLPVREVEMCGFEQNGR